MGLTACVGGNIKSARIQTSLHMVGIARQEHMLHNLAKYRSHLGLVQNAFLQKCCLPIKMSREQNMEQRKST